MADVSIQLTSLTDYKSINVEGLGVIKVRPESSNQGMRHSEIVRDIYKLQDESKKNDKKLKKLLAEGFKEDSEEIQKIESVSTATLERITELRKTVQEMRQSRLSDDEGGKLVKKLYEDASDEDIAKLFALADGTDDGADVGKETNE